MICIGFRSQPVLLWWRKTVLGVARGGWMMAVLWWALFLWWPPLSDLFSCWRAVVDLLKKNRKGVYTQLSTAWLLKAVLCVCWAGPVSDRAQSDYCSLEESNGILLQLFMEENIWCFWKRLDVEGLKKKGRLDLPFVPSTAPLGSSPE